MAKDFLSGFSSDSASPEDSPSNSPDDSSVRRERIRLILIGSAEGVREKIHQMHIHNLAEAGSWSRLLPVPNSDEVMSILMLHRLRE